MRVVQIAAGRLRSMRRSDWLYGSVTQMLLTRLPGYAGTAIAIRPGSGPVVLDR
jgi:hypothetical protein